MSDLPRYGWGEWPEHLLTKKQMGDAGFQTGKKLPAPAAFVPRSKSPDGKMYLYDKNQGVPKRQMSEAQEAALKKAQHQAEIIWRNCPVCGRYIEEGTRKRMEPRMGGCCFVCHDHDEAVKSARDLVAQQGYLILDTETIELHGEICEIAVVDADGKTLLNSLVLPRRPWVNVTSGAQRIHGITVPEMARQAPQWPVVWRRLAALIAQTPLVLTYNAGYDQGVVNLMNRLWGIKERVKFTCLMEWYAQYAGNWHDYWENYSYVALNGGHRALGDCLAARDRLIEMANAKLKTEVG